MKSLSTRPVSPRLAERLLMERRSSNRVRPAWPMTGQFRSPQGEPLTVGVVHDISSTGVCLIAQATWEPGETLDLVLTNSACTYALTVTLEVLRCHPLMNGDYYVAGRFGRSLDPVEMQPFLL